MRHATPAETPQDASEGLAMYGGTYMRHDATNIQAKSATFRGAKNDPRRPGAITPDERYPKMYRVRLPDGSLSDMVNRTRARDAASIILDASLEPHGSSPMRQVGKAA
jgi:hypothetical protein